jgi:hypothetical protein
MLSSPWAPTGYPENYLRAVDLTDGGLVLMYSSAWEDPRGANPNLLLLEPGASQRRILESVPPFRIEAAFTGPDSKVLLLDEPGPRLWDPLSNRVERLPGAAPMRPNAAAVSLDQSHVLIVGGRADDRTLTSSFLAICATSVGWLTIALLGLCWHLRAASQARVPRATIFRGILFGLIPFALLAVAVAIGVALLRLIFANARFN